MTREMKAKKILLSIKENDCNLSKEEKHAIDVAIEALDFVQECNDKCKESIMKNSEVCVFIE